MSYAFADTVTTLRTGATLQTTSTDIQAFNFNGANVVVFDANSNTAYTNPSSGAVIGNLTVAFSFVPNNVFQQVNSVRATVLSEGGIQAVSCGSTCGAHYCICGSQPGDRLLTSMNGVLVSNTTITGGFPSTSVLTLSNLKAGSNTVSLAIGGR